MKTSPLVYKGIDHVTLCDLSAVVVMRWKEIRVDLKVDKLLCHPVR